MLCIVAGAIVVAVLHRAAWPQARHGAQRIE